MKIFGDYDAGHDSELICKAQQGSLEAFNQLVLKYQDLLCDHAYAILGSYPSAEDATQESIIKAFNKIDKFQGSSFRNWLLKIVTNTCYDELRRLKRHPVAPLYPEDVNSEDIEAPVWLVDPNLSVISMVEQNELTKTLYHYLNELPDVFRSVITLIDVYEFNYSEAADILKVPLGTIKSRLARARLQMCRKFQSNTTQSPNFAFYETLPTWQSITYHKQPSMVNLVDAD
jgi:RNA polymerase sigma-70 factor (ECF subfamily)